MIPLFSIIIPVYNVEQYLRDCLDSVIAQNFNNFEAICINDGSTDGSFAILEEYAAKEPRIVIVNQQNKGLSGARNAGVKVAKGEYVFFLDSDDWIKPDTLQILAHNLCGEEMLCFSGQRYFEDNNVYEKPDVLPNKSYLSGWDYYNDNALLPRNFAFVCVVLRLYKRTFLLKNNLLFHEGIYHEDNLFTPQACSYAGNTKVISDCLYIYRVRGNSIMTDYKIQKAIDIIDIANELSLFFRNRTIERNALNRYLAALYFSGFMPAVDKRQRQYETELLQHIDWNLFKEICTYARHKRMYKLMRLSPKIMRLYVRVEWLAKKLLKG